MTIDDSRQTDLEAAIAETELEHVRKQRAYAQHRQKVYEHWWATAQLAATGD